MRKWFILLYMVSGLMSSVFAANPEQVVKKMVNAIKLKKYGENLTPEDQAYNLKMTRVAATCFDLERMAKTALADHWVNIPPETQAQLAAKIKDLVIKLAYPSKNPKIQTIQIVYKGQKIENQEAVVNSILIVTDKALNIDYKLYLKDQNWRIYDILSEGRSVIEDYKRQFNQIIELYSVEKLLQILDKKLAGE
ncbi:ABC transporter substrate-binding protein [candidate division KSB1 bacterium]|nr:ABC transporter substrate-binding protein [candidate division KSB1 bacterium]